MQQYLTLADLLFSINLADGRYSDQRTLSRASAQVYSQNGEDGIIAEIFRRIGTNDRFFVEVGIGDGLQNNSRFLLETGWRGVWIDSDPHNVALARGTFAKFLAQGALSVICTS